MFSLLLFLRSKAQLSLINFKEIEINDLWILFVINEHLR